MTIDCLRSLDGEVEDRGDAVVEIVDNDRGWISRGRRKGLSNFVRERRGGCASGTRGSRGAPGRRPRGRRTRQAGPIDDYEIDRLLGRRATSARSSGSRMFRGTPTGPRASGRRGGLESGHRPAGRSASPGGRADAAGSALESNDMPEMADEPASIFVGGGRRIALSWLPGSHRRSPGRRMDRWQRRRSRPVGEWVATGQDRVGQTHQRSRRPGGRRIWCDPRPSFSGRPERRTPLRGACRPQLRGRLGERDQRVAPRGKP